MMDFLDKDAPKSIDPIPNYNEDSLAFKKRENFDPCAENPKICSNNGKCLARDGNFYCLCPATHYGKTCEHIANQTNCAKHFCQNNATCVSTEKKRTIIDTVRLEEIRRKKRPGEQLKEEELKSLDIEVAYECICRSGFYGTLCEISEALKKCEEEYCLSRGRAALVPHQNGTKCSCSCDRPYFGTRCEQISACHELECVNAGTCIDTIDEATRTISATCQCPTRVATWQTTGLVSGERCETIRVPKEVPDELKPCHVASSSSQFFEALKKRVSKESPTDILELEMIRTNYFTRNGTNGSMTRGWCENNGKCVPEIVKLSSNNSYYIHRCDCTDPLTDGFYCEYKRKDACDLTRREMENGVRWDEKCTDFSHGVCVDIHGKASCVCKPDYVGEHCELFDPCARNPCKRGDCIPIPDSSDLALGSLKYQCLCPLSARLERGVDCVPINETKCAPGVCGNGRCVPCETQDAGDFMPMCNEAESVQGYRCLCEAGFVPPLCRSHTNPCFQNLCQNSATCLVRVEQKSYDCICLNGTRGTLCEHVDDSCEAFGQGVCVHGECVNDAYTRRGFSCVCSASYEGLDCEIEVSFVRAAYRRIVKYYQFTIPLIVCALSLFTILLLSVTTRRSNNMGNV